jgi:hypothetical protein
VLPRRRHGVIRPRGSRAHATRQKSKPADSEIVVCEAAVSLASQLVVVEPG